MYSVYVLIFPNNKYYIGQTKKSVKRRFIEHSWDRTNSKNMVHRPIIFAMKKYRVKVDYKILKQNLTKKDADIFEKKYIKQYKSLITQNGYNVSPGGNSGNIMSKKGKLRWKRKMKKYYNNPDYIQRITKHLVNRKNEDPNFYKKQSEYIKKYFSKIENRIKHSIVKGGKPFICIETGEKFQSLQLAAKKLNIYSQNIWKVLRNKRKHTKGYTFKYMKGT